MRATTLMAALGLALATPSCGGEPAAPSSAPDASKPSEEPLVIAALGDAAGFGNCGVFGERTDEIAERLDDCARGADALIVQGGINDIAQGRAVEDAAANLEAMVERGKRLGVATTLVEVLPWDNGFPEADSEIRALNGLIAEIGRRQDVTVLPFYEALEDPANPGLSARG